MKRIILMVLVWACLMTGFGLLVLNRLQVSGDSAYTWMDTRSVEPQSWNPIHLHVRWDSLWYLQIAQSGYIYRGPNALSDVVFFPIYPFAMKLVSLLFFLPIELAGWLVSIVALVIACALFYKLLREFHPKIDPVFAVFLLLIFPTAVFFQAVYTESLFLALSLATFLFALRKRFWLAGLFGFVAALTRVTGAFLALPLLVEYVQAYRWRGFWKPQLVSLALPGLGLLSFFAFHGLAFGDPTLFFKVEKTWGRTLAINHDHFHIVTSAALSNLILDASFLIFTIVMTVLAYRRLRPSYAVYMLATILVVVSTGSLMSVNRYVAVLFPIYILGASIKSAPIRYAWIGVSVLLLGLYTTLFVHGQWAG